LHSHHNRPIYILTSTVMFPFSEYFLLIFLLMKNIDVALDSDPDDVHLHATLKRIDQLANEDVEMQVNGILWIQHFCLNVFLQ
jgi:hypothetical protein